MALVRRMSLALSLIMSAVSPSMAKAGPLGPECLAEISPNTVTAGSTGQSFTLRVYNGAPLPVALPTEEIGSVRLFSNWVDLVLITSASASPSWETRVFDPPGTVARYRGGEIPLGGFETFSAAGNVEDTTATEDWTVSTSRDGGMTYRTCAPIRSGALDLIVA